MPRESLLGRMKRLKVMFDNMQDMKTEVWEEGGEGRL